MAAENPSLPAQQDETGFAIVDDPNAVEVCTQAFSEIGISNFELSRLKIPAGGSTAFLVPTLEGEVPAQKVRAIIVAMKGNEKVWWAATMDSGAAGTPPDCVSHDGVHGYGINTLEEGVTEATRNKCSECEWNRFGSNRAGGRGKDCKDTALLFFFQENSRIPTLLTVPATSLPALKQYALKLIDAGKKMEAVYTEIGLEKVMGGGGGSYSRLTLAYAGDLPEAAQAAMSKMGADIKSSLTEFDAYATPE